MLKLSKHLEDNWLIRVGNWPTREGVNRIIESSIRVQAGRDIVKQDGTVERVLGMYWHTDLELVLRVDETQRVVVTVLTPYLIERAKKRGRKYEKRTGKNGTGKNAETKRKRR